MSDISPEALKSAAINAFEKSFDIRPDEHALLIYDKSTPEVSEAFIQAAAELKIKLTKHKIEFTKGHGQDPDPETVYMMTKFHVIICPTLFSLTHCSAMHAARKTGVRGATLPGITPEIFARGLKVDPNELHTTGRKLIAAMSKNCEIHLTSRAGTDLRFNLGLYPYKNDDGIFHKRGVIGNLPAGEVFIAPNPHTASGKLVVDGSIGSQPWHEGMEPAEVMITNGSAADFYGYRGERWDADLRKHGPKGLMLAEFGIGSNPYAKMTGNLLEDEKIKGTVHLAFGNNCGFGGDNDVPVHIDGVVCHPTVKCNGQLLIEDGKWLVS